MFCKWIYHLYKTCQTLSHKYTTSYWCIVDVYVCLCLQTRHISSLARTEVGLTSWRLYSAYVLNPSLRSVWSLTEHSWSGQSTHQMLIMGSTSTLLSSLQCYLQPSSIQLYHRMDPSCQTGKWEPKSERKKSLFFMKYRHGQKITLFICCCFFIEHKCVLK